MRTGVLGGTFDPPHLGHVALASAAAQDFALERVWLVPARVPPHKAAASAGAYHRFAMTAPYYVVADGKPRVNPEAVQFFIDWLYERARQLTTLPDTPRRKALIDYHRQARDFWQGLRKEATQD